jgi:hypothetical protein
VPDGGSGADREIPDRRARPSPGAPAIPGAGAPARCSALAGERSRAARTGGGLLQSDALARGHTLDPADPIFGALPRRVNPGCTGSTRTPERPGIPGRGPRYDWLSSIRFPEGSRRKALHPPAGAGRTRLQRTPCASSSFRADSMSSTRSAK